MAEVEAAGYSAQLPTAAQADAAPQVEGPGAGDDDPTRPWRDRLLISAVLGVPVLVLAMVPALQFTHWQ
ncbi:hypothetical protein BH18ACT1_BH18ACT1_12200 [soil metagenome]